MHSIRIHNHGGPEVLQIDDIPEPSPGPGEVKVKTMATSLNRMDVWVRAGIPGIGELPLVLGCDAAGVVESVGPGAKKFKPSDRVLLFPLFSCGHCPACLSGHVNLCREFKIPGEHVDGTHREFFCVPESNLIRLDDRIAFETAAAFPLAFMTAWHMLVANGEIGPGQTILVIAASSGVGSAGVQIAKHFGARVIATAGGKDKLSLARTLGADETIDHYAESISKRVKAFTAGKGVDVILEHVGEKVWDECLKSLAWGGRLVTCGATSGPDVRMDLRHIFIKQQRIIGSTMGTKPELEDIHRLVASGALKPNIAKTFPYTDVRAAHEYLEKSTGFGKVVLTWPQGGDPVTGP